jgi:hypothetical protein
MIFSMKKFVVVICLAVAFCSWTQASIADTVTTVGGNGYGPYQTGYGGEFTLLASGSILTDLVGLYVQGKTSNVLGLGTNTFQTFCIEGSEYIYPNTTFNAAISDRAINGGLLPSAGGDPLSVGSAYLYYLFLTGDWTGTGVSYDYTNRAVSADLLQKAIWWLEGEENQTYNASNPYELLVVTKFVGAANAMADNYQNGIRQYPVQVLNLYLQNGSLAQDQLIGVPAVTDPAALPAVPEPATLLLMGFGSGFMGFGIKRLRKKFKKS